MADAFVDRAVSERKFADEVARWTYRAHEHRQRGILLLDASFPTVVAAFALPLVRPAPLLFGVELDFTNYDMWPPSIRFIDPVSGQPWPNGVVTPCTVILGGRPMPLFLRFTPDAQSGTVRPEAVVLSQDGKGRAFVCMRGVREYHEHPAHSGDSWLQYRGTGIGTLYYLLDKLHEFGIAHISGMQVAWQYVSGGIPEVVPQPPAPESTDARP